MEKQQPEFWEGKHFACFVNRDCEYFPCHSGVAPEDFNCLFCYCPLYALGGDCGGNFVMLENGVKDCGSCTIPHRKENYGHMMEQSQRIVEGLKQKDR